MAFSYPRNQRQLAGMRLEVLKTELRQGGGNAAAAHRGEAVAKVFIQSKVKKKKNKKNRQTKVRGTRTEVQNRQAKSQKPTHKKQSSKREELLRQEMLEHCSLKKTKTKKKPDKLATRGMKVWLIYTGGRGNNTQVRHVREIV